MTKIRFTTKNQSFVWTSKHTEWKVFAEEFRTYIAIEVAPYWAPGSFQTTWETEYAELEIVIYTMLLSWGYL